MFKKEMEKRIAELSSNAQTKDDEIRLLKDAMAREETFTIFC